MNELLKRECRVEARKGSELERLRNYRAFIFLVFSFIDFEGETEKHQFIGVASNWKIIEVYYQKQWRKNIFKVNTI